MTVELVSVEMNRSVELKTAGGGDEGFRDENRDRPSTGRTSISQTDCGYASSVGTD
jgi:hypothetical protein